MRNAFTSGCCPFLSLHLRLPKRGATSSQALVVQAVNESLTKVALNNESTTKAVFTAELLAEEQQ